MLSVTLVAALGLVAIAQTPPPRFGLKVGYSFHQFEASANALPAEVEQESHKSICGAFTAEFPLNDFFSVQSGLSYISKGTSAVRSDQGQYFLTYGYKLAYLELPVNALFNFEAGPGRLFLGGGPYYSVVFKAKVFTELEQGTPVGGAYLTSPVKIGNAEDSEFKRADFGVNFLTGYQLNKGFGINAAYSLGLRNISSASQGSIKNRGFSAAVSYIF